MLTIRRVAHRLYLAIAALKVGLRDDMCRGYWEATQPSAAASLIYQRVTSVYRE